MNVKSQQNRIELVSRPVKGVEALVLVDGITGRVGDADTGSQAGLKANLKLDCCAELYFS